MKCQQAKSKTHHFSGFIRFYFRNNDCSVHNLLADEWWCGGRLPPHRRAVKSIMVESKVNVAAQWSIKVDLNTSQPVQSSLLPVRRSAIGPLRQRGGGGCVERGGQLDSSLWLWQIHTFRGTRWCCEDRPIRRGCNVTGGWLTPPTVAQKKRWGLER